MSRMPKCKKTLLWIVVFSVVIIFLAHWKIFLTPGIVGHNWDWHIPYLRELNIQKLVSLPYIWSELSFGYLTPLKIYQFPAYVLGAVFNGEVGTKLFIYYISVFSVLNAFVFLRYVAKKVVQKLDDWSVFLGAFVYAFLPIVFNNLIGGQINALISYAFFPLFFYFFFKVFDEKSFLKYAFPLGIVFFLLCASQVLFFAIGLSIFFFLLLYRKQLKRFLFVITLLFLTGNSIFFYLFGNIDRASEIIPEQLNDNALIRQSFINHKETIDKVFIGAGYGDRNLFLNFMGNYRFVYFAIFYLLIILVIGRLLLKHKEINNKKLLFGVMFVYFAGLFLATAGRQPFGEFFIFLMTNFTPMKMFRTFFIFFVLVGFSFSIMTTISFSLYSRKFKQASLLMLGLLLIANLPVFIEGDNGIRVLKGLKKDSLDIYQIDPNYLDILNKQLLDPSWYRVLYVPNTVSPIYLETPYQRWGQGGDPEIISNPKPILNDFSLTPNKKKIYGLIEENIVDGKEPIDQNLLSFFSFKKIIRRRDIAPSFSSLRDRYDNELIDEKLSELKAESTSQYIDYYSLDDSSYLPHFYVPKKIIFIDADINSLSDIISFEKNERLALFFKNKYSKGNEGILEKADEILAWGEHENSHVAEWLIETEEDHEIHYPKNLNSGGWKWELKLMEEKLGEWKVRKNPDKLLEKLLLNSANRIGEIINNQNIGYLIFDPEGKILLRKIAGLWQEKMKEAISLVTSENVEDRIEKLRQPKAYFYTSKRRILDIPSLDPSLFGFEEIENQLEKLELEYDFSKLRYQLNMPQAGRYEIIISDIGELKFKNEKLDFDTETLKKLAAQEMETKNKDWTKLEERYFTKGKQAIDLPFAGLSINLVNKELRIDDYKPSSHYRVSFKYIDEGTNSSSVSVVEGKKGKLWEKSLPAARNEFNAFETIFKSSPEAKKGSIRISAGNFRDLKVVRIYKPKIAVRYKKEAGYSVVNAEKGKIKNEKLGEEKIIPKITFIKINPTKYKVKVEEAKGPYVLVFSESFNKGWKVYQSNLATSEKGLTIKKLGGGIWKVTGEVIEKITGLFLKNKGYGEKVASYFNGEVKEGTSRMTFLEPATFETWGQKPIADNKHHLVNGYANSWYIEPEDVDYAQNYELIVELLPQRLFSVGLLLSGITLFFSLCCLLIIKLKKGRTGGRLLNA